MIGLSHFKLIIWLAVEQFPLDVALSGTLIFKVLLFFVFGISTCRAASISMQLLFVLGSITDQFPIVGFGIGVGDGGVFVVVGGVFVVVELVVVVVELVVVVGFVDVEVVVDEVVEVFAVVVVILVVVAFVVVDIVVLGVCGVAVVVTGTWVVVCVGAGGSGGISDKFSEKKT